MTFDSDASDDGTIDDEFSDVLSPIPHDEYVNVPTPPKRRLVVLICLLVAMFLAANIGSAAAPNLVADKPWLVILTSSRNRHLLFTVGADISPWLYFPIAFFRLLLAAVVTFLLGEGWGLRIMMWFQPNAENPESSFSQLRKLFGKIGVPLVMFFCGSNIVCALAGIERMKRRTFYLSVSVGIAIRLVFFWFTAQYFDSELDSSLKFIQKYQWYFMLVLIPLAAYQILSKAHGIRKIHRGK